LWQHPKTANSFSDFSHMVFVSQAGRTGNVGHVALEGNVKNGYVLFGGKT